MALAKRQPRAKNLSITSMQTPQLAIPNSPGLSPDPPMQPPLPCRPLLPILIDFDSKSECRYQGGVNHYLTDDNMMELDGEGPEDSDAGYETLLDFDEGDVKDLERHVTAMGKSLYSQVQVYKSAREWKTTEVNCALRYNGHSLRTIRWQEMEAWK